MAEKQQGYFNGRLVTENGVVSRPFSVHKGLLVMDEKPLPGGRDLQGMYVVPGFIDSHIHGFGPYDFGSANCDFAAADAALARKGTTCFFPTVSPLPAAPDAARLVRAAQRAPGFAGFHLEGPFLSLEYRGGFEPAEICSYSQAVAAGLLEGFEGHVRVLTAAPECVKIDELAALAGRHGALLSAGHTAAGFALAQRAYAGGFSALTHTFNGMAPLHHREPGLLGAALLDDAVWCEVVGDMHHVTPPAFQLLRRLKPAGRVVAVTDSVPLIGEGQTVRDGMVYWGETIYGSQCTMYDVFLRLVRQLGLSLTEVVQYTATNAARRYGLACGELAHGRSADFILLDEDLAIREVFRAGQVLHPVA